MKNPRTKKTGNINTGYGKRTCSKCKQKFERVPRCPKCNSNEFMLAGAGKDNYFSISGVDDITLKAFQKLYRGVDGTVKPRTLRCTFIKPPWEAVTVGWECWQKGGLFCHCHWKFNHEVFLFDRNEKATRRPKGTLKEIEINCEPTICPYAVGGEVEERGVPIHISPDRVPCKNKIIMDLFLVGMPGLNIFRYTTAGIKSYENLSTGIQELLVLMGGRWAPLEFELVVEWGEFKRPPTKDARGHLYFPKTTGPIVSMRIPEAINKLGPGSIVQIPGFGTPDHTKRQPNELVDTIHAIPETGSQPVDLSEVKEIQDPPAPSQAGEVFTEESRKALDDLVKTYSAGSEHEYKKTYAGLRKKFGLKGVRVASFPHDKGTQMIKHMEALIHQRDTTTHPIELDDYNLKEDPDQGWKK